METEQSILDKIREDNTPFWYLYDDGKVTRRNGETSDIEKSIERLKTSLAEMPSGTYRLKAANNPRKHNGAKWHDIAISSRKAQPTPIQMTTQVSTNAYNIPDHTLRAIQEETRRTLLFEQMAAQFGPMAELVKDMEKRLAKVEKILDDEDGDGVPDFAQTMKTVSSAAETANTVKKVFTGSSLFD